MYMYIYIYKYTYCTTFTYTQYEYTYAVYQTCTLNKNMYIVIVTSLFETSRGNHKPGPGREGSRVCFSMGSYSSWLVDVYD